MTRSARRRSWAAAAALCGTAALLLTGCAPGGAADAGAAESGQPDASTEVAETNDGLTADQIVAVIEPHNLDCTVEDARLDGRDEVVTCKGDDYVIITATSLDDASTMQEELAFAKGVICENQKSLGVDAMRSGVSGKWIFVPGGDDEKNLAAFDAVMTDFGLDWNEDPC